MKTMKVTIDNRVLEVEKGVTILDAAAQAGIKIPTLCHMHMHELNYANKPGACRICVVEVEGRRNLAPACKTDCTEGMVVYTHTPRVLNARRTVMELLLSNHPDECLTCVKSGRCDLQSVAIDLGIRKVSYQGATTHFEMDKSASIVRNMDKCISCRRCETACNEIQGVGALSATNRGFGAIMGTAFEKPLTDSECVNCGQCVAVCPTGALSENPHIDEVIAALNDPTKTVVVQPAPAVRVALGQEFGCEPGANVAGKMATALRQIGFDHVFDTDFAADLTIMEEGTELLGRIEKALKGDKSVKLPLMTSCCPAWVLYMEKHNPDLLAHLSSARSPQQMFGAIAKNYFAKKIGVDRKDLIVVSVMPCVAKKYECKRPEMSTNGDPDVNISITTRELARLIRQYNIDFAKLPESEFDSPLGESTGAAVIFGVTGGVIEAAARTAYEVFTKKTLGSVDFQAIRGFDGVRVATIDFNGTPIKLGIAHGLANAQKLVDLVREGKCDLHAIEVMACPGGCIDGGGQPFHRGNGEILAKRGAGLYAADADKKIRKSHENPDIQKLYKEFLGTPCSELSEQLLHTHYSKK
ncbi:MAG: [FeFe] hydrogenase, group A [Paludibacteraceae bacterium]|nr:[FeFe] hydrogenase, group A [Paludibacteraceae bacterium]